MKKTVAFLLLVVCFVTGLMGCKKILEVRPESSITEEIYFKNEGDFEPYLTGIYTYMRNLANKDRKSTRLNSSHG